MRAFVTGGAGFLGGALVRRLVARGDEVVALARSDASAGRLEHLVGTAGHVVRGQITDGAVLRQAMAGATSVFHVAGDYRIGIPAGDRPDMYASNVDGTRVVFDAAADAGIDRIVYVSTANVFGNTGGRVVDETYRRPDRRFLSYYDETKFVAHELAEERAAAGQLVLIACSGAVYGPGDHSEVGRQIEQAAAGGYKVRMFPGLGISLAYVADTAAGLLQVHDHGRPGETYILGGENVTLGQVLDLVARSTGHRPPRITLPPLLLRTFIPFGRWAGPRAGVGPDLAEVIRASDGVTYWVSSGKARRELGYQPRDLVSGLAERLGPLRSTSRSRHDG